MSLVIELAQAPEFVDLAPVSATQIKEREREELVTRFFAYGDGLDGYKDRPSEFIFGYAKRMNVEFEGNPQLVDTYRARFLETMAFVKATFPFGFRKTKSGKATPRSRFEAIAIGSYMATQHSPQIAARPPDVSGWVNEKEFATITGSDGANVTSRLRRRMEYVRDRLLGG